MRYRTFFHLIVFSVISLSLAQPVHCQSAHISTIPELDKVDIAEMNSADLKVAIAYAVQQGDLNAAAGGELINKITDMETLLAQFDCIRGQERGMISSIGSSFH